ncbi:hypothetical protein [Rhodococcus opacus]|uniref:hypothetical protein n=1 Tax=Rhodococcus opacus TaxID=37919 RepID=UPI0013D96B2E|nr:hypothetical protein [Rhodococcus opacus]MDV7089965.1 hypothetical protein [Rhodococcus opacus]
MTFREVHVNEVKEVLRVWLGTPGSRPPGLRTIAAHCGVDRKTARRYVEAAQAADLQRTDRVDALNDGLIGAVIEAVRPGPPERTRVRLGPAAGVQRTRSPRGWPLLWAICCTSFAR